MRIGDKVQISAQAMAVKAIFPERPGDEVVEEIREFVKAGNDPHNWRGHTHTKPPVGARITYIGDLDLDPNRASPCPCCSPGRAKFYHRGMIAYFPDEHVIRIIGPDCFKTLNPEGHEAAMKHYEIEQKRRKEVEYLLNNLPAAGQLEQALEKAIEVADAIDTVRNRISDGSLEDVLGVDLPALIGSGTLRVTTEFEETYVDSSGKTNTRKGYQDEKFGQIAGTVMVKKNTSRFVNKLKAVLDAVRQLPKPSAAKLKEEIEKLDDVTRVHTARLLGNSLNTSESLWEAMDDARSFLSPNNLATINGWGRHPGSPAQIEVRREGADIVMARRGYQGRRIRLPQAFDKVLERLPKLGVE